MDDPRRLLDDPNTSPLARSLLASAGDDGPSADHRSAAAKRLGIAAITLAGAGKAGGAAVASALWWKIGLVVVLVGSVIGIAVVMSSIDLAGSAASDRARLTRAVPEPASAPADSTPPPADLAPPAGVAPEEPPAPAVPVEEVKPAAPAKRVKRAVTPEPEPPAEPPPPPEPVVEATPPPPPPVQVDARRLAAEVALLDRARGALKRRDTIAAIIALDEYRREFHDGALVAEAEVVRIEALIQGKDHASARAQAESFLARFPKSPLVRRVRSLVENLKETP